MVVPELEIREIQGIIRGLIVLSTGMMKEREKLRMTSKFLASNQKEKRIGRMLISLLYHFIFHLAKPHSKWDLSSLTRNQNCGPCIENREP